MQNYVHEKTFKKTGLLVAVLQFDRHLMCTCKTGNGRPDDPLGELTQNEPRGGKNNKKNYQR